MSKLYNLNQAYRKLLFRLEKGGFEIDNIELINNHRYILVKSKNRKNIMIMFKRDFFYTFGEMFRERGCKCLGDTINSDDLQKAMLNDVGYIYTIFPNGVAYSITLGEFLDKSEPWTNKEGKRVRSISIHNYKREFELLDIKENVGVTQS